MPVGLTAGFDLELLVLHIKIASILLCHQIQLPTKLTFALKPYFECNALYHHCCRFPLPRRRQCFGRPES